MTIEKNQPWGASGTLPDDGIVAYTDADITRALTTARDRGVALPVIGLLGGDLCRTLGGPGDAARLRGPDARRYPIDLGLARIDGIEHRFVAHLIARSGRWRGGWWHGRTVAVMNAQWLGTWDLGPKSHPNDGLLDVADGDLRLGDRIKARKRLLTGTHVPHPDIRTRRTRQMDLSLDPPLEIFLDGVAVGRGRELHVEVEPDAFEVVI